MEEKEKLLEIEQQEKKAMEDMIAEMQTKLVAGGESLEKAEMEMAQRNRKASMAVKKQRKVAKKLAEEKRAKEEEVMEM